MQTLRRIFERMEELLYEPFFRNLLELTLVGGCPYCSALRALIFGIGLGMFSYLGLALMVFAVLLTNLERYLNDQ